MNNNTNTMNNTNNTNTMNEGGNNMEVIRINYVNLFGGFKTVKSITWSDGSISGVQWNVGENLFNMFRSINNFETFSFGVKTLKEYKLARVDNCLNRAYNTVCDYKSVTRPSKECVKNTLNAVMNLYKELGIVDGRDWLYAEEFNLVMDCVGFQGTSKKIVENENIRTKFVSLTVFKKAFWNTLYNVCSGKDFVTYNLQEQARRERFARAEKAAEKAAEKRAAAATRREAREAKRAAKRAEKAAAAEDELEKLADIFVA